MATNVLRNRPLWLKLLAAFVLLLAALAVLLAFFPWDTLREPVNRYVSEKTGRKFEITRRLDVGIGLRGATVKADGIEFANPPWARDPYLVKAERAEFDIRLWPLITQKVVIPRLALSSPTLGLQMEPDGRRTWALGKDTSDPGTVPVIGLMQVDGGAVDFLATHLGVDLHADVSYDTSRGELPLTFRVKGRYKGHPLNAEGRTGNVLQLKAAGQRPFPLEVDGAAGQTRLKASGTVTDFADLDGIEAQFDLKGQTLGALFPLLGIALPETSPYALSGDLRKRGKLWEVAGLKGRLGLSDIAGDMRFDKAGQVPHLAGELRSKVMDMDDLGPLIGLPPTERSAKAVEGVAPPPTIKQVKKRTAGAKVLPGATLDFDRLRAMNADVKYAADRIRNVRNVPLDRGSVQVKLNNGMLALDPLDLGVGGGKLAGAIRIDATQNPADIRASLDLRNVQLNRLVPKIETMRSSFSRLDGRINLSGRGNSVASWLGGASGDVAALTGRGRFSNLLLEFMGLDGAEIIKFLLRGDQNVELRCAAMAFDVNKGVMSSRSMVLDTADTVFYATGQANLATEKLDFVVRPEPKDASILSLRSPLVIGGSFGAPSGGVQAGPLAERGLAALVLGALNPLLALAATIETGPGQDADCKGVLSEAQKPSAGAPAAGAAKAKGAKKKP
ncbi:AsmA family protein [Variovorax paradoxus]|uniref:AsmA family protein n=1 Tax=Variovorax paradoxus TaxID=34073 RepID=UPI0029C90901|nr:AsmA family protein [Variovorax paradoxus]WPH19510.1 AsmA family protein [Variovorax paradoxus]